MGIEQNIISREEAEKILSAAGVEGDRLFELYLKSKAVELISHAFSMGATHRYSAFGSAVRCELRTYISEYKEGFGVDEYLIVHYPGGAWAARRANWNSNSANLKEISKLLNGGYYDENADLESLEANSYRLIFGDNGEWLLRKGEEVR